MTQLGLIPSERIEQSIHLIRGQRVMLDRDLASLYGVETRVLNQAVQRNRDRFPPDFMFELSRDEIAGISQIVTSSTLKFSKRVTDRLSLNDYTKSHGLHRLICVIRG